MGTSTSGSAASVAVRTKSAVTRAVSRAAKHAERGRQLFHGFATGARTRLGPFVLSPEGKAAFAGFAAGLMLLSVVPSQLHVQPATIGGFHDLVSGNNTTATTPPYRWNISQFPTPDPLAQPGNFTHPRLATTLFGGVPTYLLLSGGDAFEFPEQLNAGLRIAGTPGNAVNLSLLAGGQVALNVTNLRTAGPPNVAHLVDRAMLLQYPYRLQLTYLPGLAGKGVGDNPANLSLNLSGSFNVSEVLQHNFNVQHLSTYVWTIDLEPDISAFLNTTGGKAAALGTHLYLRTGVYSGILAQEREEGMVPGCVGPCAPPNNPVVWSSPSPIPGYNFSITGDDLAVNGSLVSVAGSGQAATLVAVSEDGGMNWTHVGGAVGTSPRIALSQNATLLSTLGSGTAYAAVFGLTGPETAPVPLGPALNATPIWNPSFMGVLASGTFSATLNQKPVSVSGVACFTSADGGASFRQFSPATYQSVARNLSLGSTSPIFNSIGQTRLDMPGGEPGQLSAVAHGNQLLAVFTSSVAGAVTPVVATSSDGCAHWNSTTPAPPPSGGSVMDPQAVLAPNGNAYLTWRDDGTGPWTVDLAVDTLSGHVVSSTTRLPGTAGTGVGAPALTVDPLDRPLLAWSLNGSVGSSGLFVGGFLSPLQAESAWAVQVAELGPPDLAYASSSNLTALEDALRGLRSDLTNGSVLRAVQDVASVYPRVTNATLELANATFCTLSPGGCMSVVPPSVREWVLNLSGVYAPNQYLEEYADLTFEALGLAVLDFPPGDPGVISPPPPPPGGGGSGSGGSGGASGAESVSASETFVNPITADLALSWTFPTYFQSHLYEFNGDQCPHGSGPHGTRVTVGWRNDSVPSVYVITVSAGTGKDVFSTTSQSTDVDLTNLPEGTSTAWTVSVKADYAQTDIYLNGCYDQQTPTPISPPTISPSSLTASSLYGVVDVVLDMLPGAVPGSGPAQDAFVQLQTVDSGHDAITLAWTNTMPAYVSPPPCVEIGSATPCPGSASTGYTPTGSWGYVPPTPPALPPPTTESFSFAPNAPVGNAFYTAVASVSSDNATSWTQGNYFDVGPAPSSKFPLTAQLTCSFQVTAGPSISNLQATEMGEGIYQISWDASVSTPGTIEWTDEGFGGTTTVSGVQPTGPSGGVYQFQTDIRWLANFDVYHVVVFNSAGSANSCSSSFTSASHDIVTPSIFVLQEQDLPYDSVSQEGGGAMLTWDIPGVLLAHATYDSGFLVYNPLGDTTDSVQVPIPALPYASAFYGGFIENLTTLTPGTTYSVSMFLNFTENSVAVTATNAPFSFTYLKDTSGDGLSNAEKALGWTVAYTDAQGNSVNEHVTADTNSYATNGLVSDLIEKKFALDPRTIDTAGSHMLDTWNLTFQLPTVSCPTGFQCWDESASGSFDPFQLPQVPASWGRAPGDPVGPAPSNFSQGSTGFTGPDSSPWGSAQLWPNSDLKVLQGLIPNSDGYLRGVLSNSPGVGPAITVWGKLSWGANPLSTSTPGDGLADGARVNPLHEVDLQVALPFGATIFNELSSCSSFNRDAGYAIQLFVNQSSPAGTPEFQGYSNEGYFCPTQTDPPSLPPYTLTLPVANTAQTQSVQFQWIVNNAQCQPGQSGCTSPYVLSKAPLDASCSTVFSITVDLVSAPYPDLSARPNYNLQAPKTCAPNQGYLTQVSIDAGAVPSGTKTQTFLWVPTDNSTLSSLPIGLQRYTGEQDFVVVAADVNPGFSGGFVSANIPNPWGNPAYTVATNNQYQISANQGLVSFLVPRGQFLNSPFGQALMQDTVAQYPTGSPPSLPIVGGSLAGSNGLECYWQNRAVATGSFSPTSTPLDLTQACLNNGNSMGGTTLGTTQIVRSLADTGACSAGNCGGVPTNPALEANNQAPALQALVTLNLSSAAELNNLVAALLDNSTGGLNGTFQAITPFLPSLGISSAVMAALPNVAVTNSGIFGVPVSLAVPPPPPPPSCNGLGCVWNAVSGVVGAFVGAVVNGIEGFAGAVWSAAIAAATFFEAAAAGLARLTEAAVSAAVGVLKAVGSTLLHALLVFIRAAEQAAVSFLSPIWNSVVDGVKAYLNGFTSSLQTFFTDIASFLSGSGSSSTVFADAGGVLGALLGGGSIGQSFSSAMRTVGTVLSPIENLVNLNDLLNYVMGALSGLGPVKNAVDKLTSLVSGGVSLIASGLAGSLRSFGISGTSPPKTTIASLVQMQSLAQSNPSQIASGCQALIDPLTCSILQTFVQQVGTPTGWLDYMLTSAAAAVFLASIIFKLTTVANPVQLQDWVGIVLTILGFALFLAGGPVDDGFSIFVDILSSIFDISALTGIGQTHPQQDIGVAAEADLIDLAANGFDIVVSSCDIVTGNPVC